jgi:hypothetical protein
VGKGRKTIMAGDSTAVFGVFTTRACAEAAFDQLTAAGFSSQDVSAVMSDREGSEEPAADKKSKAPDGATTKLGVGGVVGGTLGLLAGVGVLAIPGVGPLIAAGPILATLAALGVGGAVGGLAGALVGLGVPEYEAKLYHRRVKDGGLLLSVFCGSCDEVSKARDILTAAGAEDIASLGEGSIDLGDVEGIRTSLDSAVSDQASVSMSVTDEPVSAAVAREVEAFQ